MNKATLAKIMPERELIVTVWELVKAYCDYGPTAPESRTQQLLTDLKTLYDGGMTAPQKALAKGLSKALADYFTTKAQ